MGIEVIFLIYISQDLQIPWKITNKIFYYFNFFF